MNEKPLERLNYYNGMPLNASDFKTEQEYHMRTRRWLNKSLYSAGIARGLEVRAITEGPKKGTPYVAVGPGLALDNDGREIILLEEATVEVCSFAGKEGSESTVVGNYLVIEYEEETIAYEQGGCAVRTADNCASKSTTNWGGPSRIRSQVKFSWVPFVPQPGSNQIVLARVELAEGCGSVYQIDPGARRYIGAASAAMVRQYALEGEREVACIPIDSFPDPKPSKDISVTGKIYFHIRGRQPNSVTLYLRADQFSIAHYTEMGQHTHGRTLTGASETERAQVVDTHSHGIGTLAIGTNDGTGVRQNDGEHSHVIEAYISNKLDPTFSWNIFDDIVNNIAAFIGYPEGEKPHPYMLRAISRIGGNPENLNNKVGLDVQTTNSAHTHGIVGNTGAQPSASGPLHKHALSLGLSIENFGVSDSSATSLARSGEMLTYVDDLLVFIGPVGNAINRTDKIRDQLADINPSDWRVSPTETKKLGNGGGGHVFADKGTGAIRLDFLPGMTFSEGEYCIELKVDAKTEAGKRVANGGKIHYNLYIV